MNNKKAKEIRGIIPPSDPIGRRNYRRAKKTYSKLSGPARILFLHSLRATMQSN
jgi:hypothetical protein